ncbi:hypothetical protein [Tissierella carlieri]|nr:hypothetical protein [Tissierella carlieri]
MHVLLIKLEGGLEIFTYEILLYEVTRVQELSVIELNDDEKVF